ncbi:MAG: response regulator [Candidatus Saccharimonadales bacterium]
MTKIMLVEDDKSLREIYGVRLLAEGYDIVSAGDGEEALAMAIKERPQLILSDVMMPKISGFDLLDILRSTTETKNIRVIMMTALSSEDQRLRGEQLGADRYLVKSQVGIEDVVRVVHEILEDSVPAATSPTPAPTPTAAQPAPMAPTYTPTPRPIAQSQPDPVQYQTPQSNPIPPPAGSAPLPVPTAATAAPTPVAQPPQARAKVITPLNDPTVGVNLTDLLNKEIAKEAGIDTNNAPSVASIEQTQSLVDSQIDQFANAPAIEAPTVPSDIPTVNVNADGTMSGPTDSPELPKPTPPPQPPQTS